MRIINEDVLKKNIQTILKTNPLMLVVKDNAYGFGIQRMVRIAKECHVKDFAVKSLEEGVLVRRLNETANILLFGKIKKTDVLQIKQYRLIPTINDYDDYILFKENHIPCHLAIDTGMNRFGMKSGFLSMINDGIVKAIYTHCYNDQNRHKIKYMERLAR
ncbi:hypothetical protein HDR67_03195, partial [bacterium]|nr:hypothetical protein [bacterium]